MTTRPLMWTLPNSWRMASTAALSAAFSSPRPRSRAAAMAAASVTRATSSTKTRSSPPTTSWPWMLFIIVLSQASQTAEKFALQRLDPDHLRWFGHVAVRVDGAERGANGLFGGFMRDQNHRRRRPGFGLGIDPGQGPARPPLHDAFQRDAALAHAAGD